MDSDERFANSCAQKTKFVAKNFQGKDTFRMTILWNYSRVVYIIKEWKSFFRKRFLDCGTNTHLLSRNQHSTAKSNTRQLCNSLTNHWKYRSNVQRLNKNNWKDFQKVKNVIKIIMICFRNANVYFAYSKESEK